MTKKEFILQEIETLKREKPEHWKGTVRYYLRDLAQLADPFAEHVYRSTEAKGRHSLPPHIKPW